MFCFKKGLKSFNDPLNHSLEKHSHNLSHNLTEMAPPTGDKSISNNPFQITKCEVNDKRSYISSSVGTFTS